MSVERDWRIAVHESGHATVARLLKLPCRGGACRGGASIVKSNAHAHFAIDHGVHSIVALMSGAAAELVAFGDYDEVGVRYDAERAWERLERYGYDDAEPLWSYTLALVRRHRSLITRLAVKLKRAGTLDGPTLDALVWRG